MYMTRTSHRFARIVSARAFPAVIHAIRAAKSATPDVNAALSGVVRPAV
jgi:hypothetical protein